MKNDSAWRWSPEMDAVKAAPESHRILLENDGVRVLEVVIPAGSCEQEHTHQMPSVMIVDQPAIIKYYKGAELIFCSSPEDTGKTVAVQWLEPEEPHSIENADTVPYHAYRIELKRSSA